MGLFTTGNIPKFVTGKETGMICHFWMKEIMHQVAAMFNMYVFGR